MYDLYFAINVKTMLTMCVYNSILLLLLLYLFKRDKLLKTIGPKCMITLLLVNIIRMYFPFEFPYTYSVYVEDVLTPFRLFLSKSIVTEPYDITIWRLLMGVWVVVAVILFVRRIWDYMNTMRTLFKLPKVTVADVLQEYGLYNESYDDVRHVRVVYGEMFKTPCVVGVLHPCILLPDMDYDAIQLRYILLHELMHVRKKDVVWKILIDFLCTFFWWNPVLYLMKKELFKLIELRNDMVVTENSSDDEIVEYMECLKAMAVTMSAQDMAFGLAFSRSDFKELKSRLKLIAGGNQVKKWVQCFVSIIVIGLLLLGSAIVIEPISFEGLDPDWEVTRVDETDTFLVKNGDDYDVYLDGRYMCTVESREGFEGVVIYDSLEEVPKTE